MIFHSTDLTDLCQSWLLSSSTKNRAWEHAKNGKTYKKNSQNQQTRNLKMTFLVWIFNCWSQSIYIFFQNVRHLKTDNCFSSLTKSTRPIRPTRPIMPSPLFGGFRRLSVEKQTIAELAAFCPLGAPGRKSSLYRSSSSSCDRKMKEGVEQPRSCNEVKV